MYSQNQIHLIGHLTAAPELKQIGSGTSVCDLNIKTVSKITTENGQEIQSAAFHTVTLWRRMAEIAADYCKAGSQVYITGYIKTDSWEAPDGQKRYKTKVIGNDLIILDPKNGNGEGGGKLSGGLNSVLLVGNLTADPELRQTTSGQNVVNFGIATNRNWIDRNTNEKKEEVEFHTVIAWRDLAQMAGEELKKGQKVFVQGRLQTRSWEAPDGNKRYATEVNAEQIIKVGIRDTELAAGAQTGAAAPAGNAPTPAKPTAKPADKKPVAAEKEPDLPAINYESDIKPEDLPF